MSKELERLSEEDRVFLKHIKTGKLHVLTSKCYQDLLEKQKALEIIKNKDVNPVDIRCCDTVEQYNVKENGNIPLTQEEYELLKDVLL